MSDLRIVDYGMGNLRSVQKACEHLGFTAKICSTPEELAGAEKVILPGVGAFRDAIAQLRSHGFVEPLRAHVRADKPLLGICLGLQLLFDRSFEDGEWEGLGVIAGDVVRFQDAPGLKIPHMGWNALEPAKECRLLADVPAGAHVYFVHSYHVVPQDENVIAARATHGEPFVAVISRGNLYATQFHPEKSQRHGLRILENFCRL